MLKFLKENWKPAYTWVLVFNVLYILLFYILMKYYR